MPFCSLKFGLPMLFFLSLSGWIFPLRRGSSSSLLILPGLLRSDGEALVSPLLRENGRTPEAFVGDVNSLLWNFIQPLFFTEFLRWAILISPLCISLINVKLSSCFLISPTPSPLRIPWIHRGWTPTAQGGFLPSADFILSFFLSPFSSLCSTPSVSVSFSRSRQRLRKSVLNVHWKDWCWSWSSNTLATWCGELSHWKSPWCWERLKAGGEGGDREWVSWMASPTRWTQLWASSRSWWWTERPGVLQSMGLQSRTRLSDWTELNWRASETDL